MSATLAHENTHSFAPTVLPVARRGFFPASARAVLLNYFSAAAIILLGLAFYTFLPYYAGYFTPFQHGVLMAAAAVYLLALPLYYATFPDTHPVKCRLFWRAVRGVLACHRPRPEELNAVRAVGIKAFFMPLMVAWLIQGFSDLPKLWSAAADAGVIGFHYLCLSAIVLTDLSFFTVSYGLEHPRLGNEVRSAEPSILGWAFALICYPPFSTFIALPLLGWYEKEVPPYQSWWVALPVSLVMLGLMASYAWASVALGLRGGNLTNRGTVDRGPYQFVRHPAYLCKNLFWCVGAFPALIAAWGNWLAVGAVLLSSAAWFFIYTMRGITEEWHMKRDPEYRAYCERVRYRYIPGVW